MPTNPFSVPTELPDERGVFGEARLIRKGFLYRVIEIESPIRIGLADRAADDYVEVRMALLECSQSPEGLQCRGPGLWVPTEEDVEVRRSVDRDRHDETTWSLATEDLPDTSLNPVGAQTVGGNMQQDEVRVVLDEGRGDVYEIRAHEGLATHNVRPDKSR